VELEFVSPENVAECIQLVDEVRLLPEDHPAKVEKLEVVFVIIIYLALTFLLLDVCPELASPVSLWGL